MTSSISRYLATSSRLIALGVAVMEKKGPLNLRLGKPPPPLLDGGIAEASMYRWT